MEILNDNGDKKGAFYIKKDNQRIAGMTYVYAGASKIIIDHTEVDSSLKGQGVGYKLVEEAVQFARKNNLKITPLCPFAAAVFKKKAADYNDVKA
ncbi:GNAT family N-acetyltransferase [Mangrovimonas spongiae]|uniref:N-acetyltransferase n=1 Tax=Mangrovimonas spongiae TaxID=2494697 RepID=A0A3R9N498_9FLAO|nr:GNAT family N-acetyltransferase [Mangrovimonas spongiae]RSK38659.1 N-acetyltransferase [Mangrovimonas spongiae]